jgi:deoxyadenosine/deoxycytidine kinase
MSGIDSLVIVAPAIVVVIVFLFASFTKSKTKRGRVVFGTIEGNISSGKSTLIREIRNRVGKEFVIIDEPVKEWEAIKCDGKNILERFYEDQKEYAFAFQILALRTRFEKVRDTITQERLRAQRTGTNTVVLIERTVLTDYHVFAKMLFDAGHITDIEMMIYEGWYNMFSKQYRPHKSVYVRTEPCICHDRVKVRSRDGEDQITLDYLQKCHKQHEYFYDRVLKRADCLVVDNSIDASTDEYSRTVDRVIEYFRGPDLTDSKNTAGVKRKRTSTPSILRTDGAESSNEDE